MLTILYIHRPGKQMLFMVYRNFKVGTIRDETCFSI